MKAHTQTGPIGLSLESSLFYAVLCDFTVQTAEKDTDTVLPGDPALASPDQSSNGADATDLVAAESPDMVMPASNLITSHRPSRSGDNVEDVENDVGYHLSQKLTESVIAALMKGDHQQIQTIRLQAPTMIPLNATAGNQLRKDAAVDGADPTQPERDTVAVPQTPTPASGAGLAVLGRFAIHEKTAPISQATGGPSVCAQNITDQPNTAQSQMQGSAGLAALMILTSEISTAAKIKVPQKIEAVADLNMTSELPQESPIGLVFEKDAFAVGPGKMAPADLIRHIAPQMIAVVTRDAGNVTEIALSPVELGKLRLNITLHDGGIILHVLAERPETADLLRRHIDALGQEFRDLGFGDVTFTFGDGRSTSAKQENPTTLRDATSDDAVLPENTASRPRTPAMTGLDLRL